MRLSDRMSPTPDPSDELVVLLDAVRAIAVSARSRHEMSRHDKGRDATRSGVSGCISAHVKTVD